MQAIPTLEQVEAEQKAILQSAIRQKIAAVAGDNASLLGTTTDAVHLLFFEMAKLAASIASASSLAEVKKAAEPFAKLTASFRQEVADGQVKFPFDQKSNDVVADLSIRATAIAAAMEESAAAFSPPTDAAAS